MKLSDLDATLVIEPDAYRTLPPHVAAFCSYLIPNDLERLNAHASLAGDSQSYQQIAAAGYALAKDPSGAGLVGRFKAAFEHLSGRTFFAEGRTPRFEVDSVALLGVALGASAAEIPEAGIGWLHKLLRRSSGTLLGDHWQQDMVEIARGIIDEKHELSIRDRRLRIAFSESLDENERQAAWAEMVACCGGRDAVQIAVNRSVFERCAASLAAMPIAGAGVRGLIAILEGLAQSMSHWTYETRARVKGVTLQQWEVDHEYHVQNLLWTLLRPVFADLVDEQALPKVGHKTPRYDLGVPSLGSIIEVKFMRRAGRAECRKITEEIAADRSLYLGAATGYSRLIAFIWDECRQTEEYQTLKKGLEGMEGIERVVILPRPSRMGRGNGRQSRDAGENRAVGSCGDETRG